MKKYAINRRIHRDPTTYFKSHPILEVLKYIAVIIGSYAISKLEKFVNKHDDTTKEQEVYYVFIIRLARLSGHRP